MKKPIILIFILCLAYQALAQIDPIVITEQTIKVGKSKEFYYAFSEGDELLFDLQVIKGKKLKEVEIVEYPHSSKLFEYKIQKITGKKIKVNKSAIYKFRLKGGGIGTKVCRLKIARIPSSVQTQDFDTSIEWKVRYDSTYTTEQVKELVKTDTNIVSIVQRTERVHSKANLDNPNISTFNVDLPKNKKDKLYTSELVSWGYWIGVGNEGQEAYQKEKKSFLQNSIPKVSSLIDPVAGLALGAYTILHKPPKGDNVKYWMTGYIYGIKRSISHGNSIVASGRVTNVKQGSFTVTLQNDNLINGINVNIRISAVMVEKVYQYRSYQKLHVKQHKFPVRSAPDTMPEQDVMDK